MTRQTYDWIQKDGYRKAILSEPGALGDTASLVQLVQVPPGSHVRPHFHKQTHEFIYVLHGTAEFRIGDQSLNLSTHDAIITRPGDVHEVRNDSGSVWEVLVFKTNVAPDDSYTAREPLDSA